MRIRALLVGFALMALGALPAKAAVSLVGYVEFGESGLTAAIPDNNLAGMARSVTVSGIELKAPYVVTVSMKIVGTGYGAWNGDYYADLRHVSTDGTVTDLAVLLNRPGRSSSLGSGYSDNGMDITLSDSAATDIHNYRIEFPGGNSNPIGAMLTGTWQADGRNVSPLSVLDTSLRTTNLNGLGMGSPNGTWTLFIADAKAGGTGQLTDWKVTMQGVPEPSSASLLILGLAAVLARRRRCRRSAV